MAADDPARNKGRLTAMLRRHLVWLAIAGVLGAGVGAAAAAFLPASYASTASVLVSPLEGNPYSPQGRGDDLINLETEAQLVGTDAVAKIVAERMPGKNLAALRSQVAVAVPPNTQVINIRFTDVTPVKARDGAQAYAASYLAYREKRAKAVVDTRLQRLKEQSERVERNLRTTTEQYAKATGSQRSLLAQRVTGYTQQLSVIEEQANDINSTPINPGQVINPAALPSGPGMTRFLLFGGGGLAVGLVLAFLLALAREQINQLLRHSAEIEAMGFRVLSVIPAEGGADRLELVDDPQSSTSKAYRRLRAGIVAATDQSPLAMIVTSASPQESVTDASANLAVALAFAGSKTILIDGTPSGIDPSSLFGLHPDKGLSDTLMSGTDPAGLLINADPHLRLLPRGIEAASAAHRLSGPRMQSTIEALRRRADFLLINATSVHDADAQALCSVVDSVLLVVKAGVTTRQQLQQARTEVTRAGTKIIGVLLDCSGQHRPKRSGPHVEEAAVAPAPAKRSQPPRAPRSAPRKPPEADEKPLRLSGYDEEPTAGTAPTLRRPPADPPAAGPRRKNAAAAAKQRGTDDPADDSHRSG